MGAEKAEGTEKIINREKNNLLLRARKLIEMGEKKAEGFVYDLLRLFIPFEIHIGD